jgi:tungstate transport system ATP-binding protein
MPDARLKTIDGGRATVDAARESAPLLMQARGLSFRPQGKPLVTASISTSARAAA